MTKEELLFAEMKPDVAAAVKELLEENERLKVEKACLTGQNKRLNGIVEGLKFAIRCNGVSGGEVME